MQAASEWLMQARTSIWARRRRGTHRMTIVLALALWAAAVWCAQALVVTINLGWGYNQDVNGNNLSQYHLQEGSIIQIVMYDSSVSSPPGPDAIDNFEILGNNPSNPNNLDDTTVYDPTTTPAGHDIVHLAVVEVAEYMDDNGNVWWNTIINFTVAASDYDRLYIRVFGATEFSHGTPEASYWGLSDVRERPDGTFHTWPIGIWDEIAATNTNYFEVIPEPGVMTLMVLGAGGLVVGARRRRKNRAQAG